MPAPVSSNRSTVLARNEIGNTGSRETEPRMEIEGRCICIFKSVVIDPGSKEPR